MSSSVTEALVWFLFVIVMGLLATVFAVCVVSGVKEVMRRRSDPVPEAPRCEEMEPVDWIPAVMIANPDDTCVWGAVKA